MLSQHPIQQYPAQSCSVVSISPLCHKIKEPYRIYFANCKPPYQTACMDVDWFKYLFWLMSVFSRLQSSNDSTLLILDLPITAALNRYPSNVNSSKVGLVIHKILSLRYSYAILKPVKYKLTNPKICTQKVCLCWGFMAQSTQWGHVECGQFT